MTFQETVTHDRRLSLLLVLAQTPAYRANAFLLRDAIASMYGHSASSDQVKTDLAWLAEQGLLSVQSIGDVMMATLMTRGQDVATGRAEVPGVRKPSA